jgi:hypothetical protein
MNKIGGVSMEPYIKLKLGETEYRKPNLSILQKLEEITKWAALFGRGEVEKINAEYRLHLMKVCANGEMLDSELKINSFFASRPVKEFMAVTRWAWIGGLEDFLENSSELEV